MSDCRFTSISDPGVIFFFDQRPVDEYVLPPGHPEAGPIPQFHDRWSSSNNRALRQYIPSRRAPVAELEWPQIGVDLFPKVSQTHFESAFRCPHRTAQMSKLPSLASEITCEKIPRNAC